MSSTPTPAPATRLHLAAAISLVLAVALSVLDTSLLYLALPGIARDLGVDASASVWVINAYQIAVLAGLFPLAFLGDRFGYRRVHLTGLAVFVLASLACMGAQSFWQLALARSLQGLGAAGMFAVNAALLRTIFPPALLGRGFAINSAVVAATSVAGPAIAAAILSVASWHWLFALHVPCGLVVWLAGMRWFPHHRQPSTGMAPSVMDLVLNTAMLVLVFLGLNQFAPQQAKSGVDLPLALVLLIAGLLFGIVHLRRQRHHSHPLLPVDLLRLRVFALAVLSSVLAFSAYTVGLVALPFLLLQDLALDYREAGWVMTAWPLATLACAPLAGRLIGRVPAPWLGAGGMGTMALGLLVLALLPASATAAAVAAGLALCGAGFALFQSPNNHAMASSAPAHRLGAAGGMMASARLTGQTLGAALVATLFGWAQMLAWRGASVTLAAGALCALAAGAVCLVRTRDAT